LPKQRTILAIGAHPDDVEIGCGGALAKHAAQGDRIFILTLTHGSQGGDPAARVRESARAAQLIGATLRLEDFPDGAIGDGVETIKVVQETIAECRPTHVYTHSLQETHQDHRNVHLSTIVASRGVSNVYCYQSPSSTVEFRPNLFVDISSHLQMKLDLIAAHESQVSHRKILHAEMIQATARYWGRFAGCILAEPMVVFRRCV